MDMDRIMDSVELGTEEKRRVWIVLASVVVLALVAAAIAVGRGSDRPLRLASTCPDAGPVSPLDAPQQQTADDVENLVCVQVPDTTTTSTSIDLTSTTVDASVDTSLPTTTLSESKDGLRVTVDVKPPELKTADILTLRITARDSDGGELGINVHWEPDRGGTVRTHNDCYKDQPRPTEPSVRTKDATFSYRQPGIVPIAVTVDATYCPEWELKEKTVKVQGKVTVGPGLVLSNGPLPLELRAKVLEEDTTASTTAIGVWATERDGFIHTVEVDWGDGSAPEVVATPLAQCVDPITTWPGPARFDRVLLHDYPVGGHVARVTVKSSGCKGLDEETKTVEVPIP